ncbi:MAG: hypothetical protein ACFE0R_16610 [Salinarimonas sp.]
MMVEEAGKRDEQMDDPGASAALGTALDAAMSHALDLERDVSREGAADDNGAREVRIRRAWADCDDLVFRIAAVPLRSSSDLRVKAKAFLWLDGGLSAQEGTLSARLLSEVMGRLTNGDRQA